MTAPSLEQIQRSFAARPSGNPGLYRPVACLTLALNWYFGRDEVFGYHLVNFIIHLGATWAVFLTILTLFKTPRLAGHRSADQRLLVAGAAALLWALNPVQTQAVTYIVQRMASLASMFALWALYCYLRARLASRPSQRGLYFFASLVCFLLGFLSKENVVVLPLALPLLEVLFFSADWLKGPALRRSVLALGLALAFCLVVTLLLRPDIFDFIWHYYRNRPFTLWERLLTEQRVLLFYLSQLFFPSPARLSIEHDIVLSTSLFSPWTTAAAIAANLLLIGGAVKIGRRHPFLSLAVLFFYLNHVVESTILPLELIFEHRNYLPSVFLFVPIAQGIAYLLSQWRADRLRLTVVVVLAAMLFGTLGYATHVRNRAWRTEQTLWLDALTKAPQSARPLATLAILLGWSENPSPAKYRKALEMTERTLTLRMARKLEADQLGNMAALYDKLGQADQAEAYYQKALEAAPRRIKNRYDFAKLLARQGRFDRSREEVGKLFDRGIVRADHLLLVGFTYLWQDRPDRALASFHQALKRAPGRPDILLAIGTCFSAAGDHQRARWFLRQAERAGGDRFQVELYRLQNALAGDDLTRARQTLKRMLARYPLPAILGALRPTEARYLSLPLDNQRLRAFVVSEVKTIEQMVAK